MASVRVTFGKDFDISNSVALSFIPSGTPYSPNNTYISRIWTGVFMEFSSPSWGGFASYTPINVGFYQDFSDNVAGVDLSGADFGDVLRGGAGNDTLNGGAGDDVLEGGLGNNVIDGESGRNTVTYENYIDSTNYGLIVDLSGGTSISQSWDVTLLQFTLSDQLTNIQNVIGSNYRDLIFGSIDNNVFEGGGGNDYMSGLGGIDTASYNSSLSGVTVNLTSGSNKGGDAENDTLIGISNVLGSKLGDSLTGDASANTLTGNGGGDALYGRSGNDRLVIIDTPTMIDGGADKDYLFVQGGGSISLSEGLFIGIEAVYVRNDTSLDMSAVTTGSRITSQSTSGHHAEIVGTSGSDRIVAGKGGDTIEGGAGGDKLFAGAGSDTFHFKASFGLDNIYRLDVAHDHIAVDIAGVDAAGIQLTEFRGGHDTIVTFAGVDDSNAIILRDVSLSQAQAALDNGLFTFGV